MSKLNIIKVGIVDDQLLFRKGLISLLEEVKNLSICLEAANGVQFFEILKKNKNAVDVLVLDVEMPEMDGLEVLKILKLKDSNIKVLVLTTHNEDALIYELVKLGAMGFLPKNADIDEVILAIETLNRNELYFNEHISKMVIKKVIKREENKYTFDPLHITEREKDIIKLICEEKSTKQIADILCISERTVNTHKSNIFEKTKAKNSAGVVMFAVRNGIVN